MGSSSDSGATEDSGRLTTKENGTKDAGTCKDWTVGDASAKTMLGHADRMGRNAALVIADQRYQNFSFRRIGWDVDGGAEGFVATDKLYGSLGSGWKIF